MENLMRTWTIEETESLYREELAKLRQKKHEEQLPWRQRLELCEDREARREYGRIIDRIEHSYRCAEDRIVKELVRIQMMRDVLQPRRIFVPLSPTSRRGGEG